MKFSIQKIHHFFFLRNSSHFYRQLWKDARPTSYISSFTVMLISEKTPQDALRRADAKYKSLSSSCVQTLHREAFICVISGFRHVVNETFALLGCYAT